MDNLKNETVLHDREHARQIERVSTWGPFVGLTMSWDDVAEVLTDTDIQVRHEPDSWVQFLDWFSEDSHCEDLTNQYHQGILDAYARWTMIESNPQP